MVEGATARPRLAIPFGDPNGIGPEIALKAALDPRVRAAARLLLVADVEVVEATAARLGLAQELADLFARDELVLHPIAALDGGLRPGAVSAEAGRATVAYAGAAIDLAVKSAADAVVAGPHNETAVAEAGIAFDGYPGLLARQTDTPADKVFLMLVGPDLRIVHVTLHLALRAALDAITTPRVLDAARATDKVLRSIGIAKPRIAACGINPHAGEGGLFGDEDDRIVRPAVETARSEGIVIDGPAGADLLLAENAHDAYLAMYHDQGHIPIKRAGRGNSFGISIGAPVLLSTVAHGSAHDIAGQGVADPAAFIGTILKMSEFLAGAQRRAA